MQLDERWQAIHETGHVLVALSFGWPVITAGITNGAIGKGAVRPLVPVIELDDDGPFRPGAREVYEQILIQLAAGAAAERLVYEEWRGHGSDMAVHAQHVKDWPDEAQKRLPLRYTDFYDAMMAATAILTGELYRPLLRSLPTLLVERKMVGANELRQLVCSSWAASWHDSMDVPL